MKKFFTFILTALMAMGTNALDFSVGQLNYRTLSNGEVECDGFTDAALAQNPTSVTIPGRVAYSGTEYKVYSIAAIAFKFCTSLKYVTVDWGIVEIGQQAFSNCSSIYIVRLPSTVTTIKENAFADCTSMGSFGIAATTPPQTTSTSFARMKKCDVHVATQAAVTAYNSNSTWTAIDSDGSVQRMPNLACDFSDDNRYYIIHTGRTVSSYSGKATLIGVAENVTYVPITNVTDNVPKTYGGCSNGYTAQLTRIAPYACQGNTKITSVGRRDLGNATQFEEVGRNAFQNCTALTLIGIPRGTIGYEAFRGCTALSSVQLYSTNDYDNGVNFLGAYAFYNCTSLHELMVYNTNTTITLGAGAFGNNASDFKCYVPIKGFYTVWNAVYNWNIGTASAQYVQPCIVPKTEWAAISCYKPMLLPSSAQFYYVYGFKTSSGITAKKQQIIGSVDANNGLLMKATPGTIYRFTISSSGASTTDNYLMSVNGNNQNIVSDTQNTYYSFNPSTKSFDLLQQSTTFYSGEAYLRYPGATQTNSIFLEGVYEPYGLKIGGVWVTNENCNDLSVINGVTGTVNYNPNTKILTLSNATITGNIDTYINGIRISVLGTNEVRSLNINEQTSASDESASIIGSGALTVNNGMTCGCNLTIGGGIKLSVIGATSTVYDMDYAIYGSWHEGQNGGSGWMNRANITVRDEGTELYVTSKTGLVYAKTFTISSGLYVAKPRGASFKAWQSGDRFGYFVDANDSELRNTELLIKGGSRGFKVNGIWYDYVSNGVTVIEPQLGENYTGEITVPSTITYNGQNYNVCEVDSDAFTGTTVTRIDLPSSITHIFNRAFKDAKSLKTLVIGYPYSPSYIYIAPDFVGGNSSGFACYVTNRYLTSYKQSFSGINFLPWVEFDDNVYQPFACAISVKVGGSANALKCYKVTDFDVSTRTAKTTLVNQQSNSTYSIQSRLGLLIKGEPNTRYLLPQGTLGEYTGTDNYLKPYITVEDSPLNIQDDNVRFYFNNYSNEWVSTVSLAFGQSFLCVPKNKLGGDFTSPIHLDLEYTPSGLLGDVDGSGIVDVEDVNAAINIILRDKTIDDYPGSADLDGSGVVDIEDVNAIINIILRI